MRPRDTGRKAVYEAEDEVFGVGTCRCPPMTLDQIRVLAEEIAPGVKVKDGRGRRRAGGCRAYITMPRAFRCMHITLHELAHTLTDRATGQADPWHGARWRVQYLHLVLEYLPNYWGRLGDAFRARNLL